MFVAMLAVLACQVYSTFALEKTHWAYIPEPAIFQLAKWEAEDIPIFINNTNY